MVITGRTRNALALRGTWVRIPSTPINKGIQDLFWMALFFLEGFEQGGCRGCQVLTTADEGKKGPVNLFSDVARESHQLRYLKLEEEMIFGHLLFPFQL